MGGGRASRKDDGRGTGRKRREKGKEGRKEGELEGGGGEEMKQREIRRESSTRLSS